jgi:hypothetical protein
MSYGELKTIGYSLGMSEPDNWKSKIYNGSTSATDTARSGNGMTINRPYVSRASFIGAARDNVTPTGLQYENCINTSITQRRVNDKDI